MIKIVSSFTILENLKVALDDKIQSSSLVFYRRNMTQRTPFICKKKILEEKVAELQKSFTLYLFFLTSYSTFQYSSTLSRVTFDNLNH